MHTPVPHDGSSKAHWHATSEIAAVVAAQPAPSQ
jgi:hypothetical protein